MQIIIVKYKSRPNGHKGKDETLSLVIYFSI